MVPASKTGLPLPQGAFPRSNAICSYPQIKAARGPKSGVTIGCHTRSRIIDFSLADSAVSIGSL